MNRYTHLGYGALFLLLVACGGSVSAGGSLRPEDASGKKDAKGNQVSKEAAASFDRALQGFLEHDKKQDWAEASCNESAKSFEDAADSQKSDAGRALTRTDVLAVHHRRCPDGDERLRQFYQPQSRLCRASLGGSHATQARFQEDTDDEATVHPSATAGREIQAGLRHHFVPRADVARDLPDPDG